MQTEKRRNSAEQENPRAEKQDRGAKVLLRTEPTGLKRGSGSGELELKLGPDHGCLHHQELGLCAWETKGPMSNWDDASFQGPSCPDHSYATGCGSHIGNCFFWSLMS